MLAALTQLRASWEHGERVFYRVFCDEGNEGRHEVLVVTPAGENPTSGCLDRLTHEYGLRDHLETAWAARPLELLRERGRTMLLLEDPGGEPLAHLVGSPIAIPTFLNLAAAMAVALRGLHKCGLVHRDINPANVLVKPSTGEVWLTGFAVASRLPRERQAPSPPESIAGTLAYMAPEQTGRMNRSIDSRSDLYALGVTFYQMLTGALPFTASDPMEWVHCHIARQPLAPSERLAGVPAAVSQLVMKLLAKTPEERYQTASGVEHDLRRCLADYELRRRIDEFPLAMQDLPDRLLIPEKLYGREPEVGALLKAFERVVAQGTTELVLVSGYSGVGKSSVVNELHKALVPPRGLFAAGKFDQHKRDTPYATLAQAFQMLVREILVKSDAVVEHWRLALLEALGPNGQLITNIIPDLEFIIGIQPAPTELPPQEARGRFQLVFRRFLGAFARPEHPLVLFLDDLQWLDAATLELLEYLVTDRELRHLLLIGAFRDNEVGSSHPLAQALTSIRKAGVETQELVLAPLALDEIERFAADALHCSRHSAATLAVLIHEKTGGNPFFAIQFMISLVEDGLLRFVRDASSWTWDTDRIRATGYSDNIVDLMVAKLKRLPGATQAVLQELSCLGNAADIATLRIIFGQTEENIHTGFLDAALAGLVRRSAGGYAFVHDRVQEAAYALIPLELRAAAHLRIGKLLNAHIPPERREEAIFEIVDQLNRGAGLIDAENERVELAALNLIAGKRAKSSVAYASALNYLVIGGEVLGDHAWASRRDLIFALELERAGCELLTGALLAADERLTTLSNRAVNTVERAALACLHIDVCTTLDQNARAVAVTLEYLGHVGVLWSPHPTEAEVRREYQRTWALLKGREIEELIDLPVIADPKLVGTLDVLERGLNPALFTDANLLSLVICGLVNLSLEHGNTGASCNGYAWFGMIAGPNFGNYQAAFRFGQLGYHLVERPGLERFKAHTYLSFAVLILPWRVHVRAGRAVIRRAFEAAIAMGDLPTAVSCGVDLFGNLFTAGHPLADVQSEVERSLEFAQKAGFGLAIDLSKTHLALVRTLRGSTPVFGCFNDAQFDELQVERRSSSDGGGTIASCWYWIRKLQARFFAGDYGAAVAASLNAQRLLWTSPSFLETAEAHFYGALSHAACCGTGAPSQSSQHIEALTAHHRQLMEWAENCPENFENRAALVGAEIARIEGRDLDAMRLYEEAIRLARENEFVHNEALANELAGRFYLARGFETAGYAYLRSARQGFDTWGASGKVKQLDEQYPRLRPDRNPPSAGLPQAAVQLDVESIARASQAISSEIVLPRLIEKLVRIAMEHAGAERGLLILTRRGEPWIEAEAITGAGGIEVLVRQQPVVPSDLAESALLYVIRTQKRVLLDDASVDEVYSGDDYVRRKRSRSVLCLPIVKQKNLVGALYLENNLAPFVFTPERLIVLELLASQAAISLENATLYTDLQLQVGLLQQLPVSAWTLKSDGTPDFVNQVWLEFSGQTLEFVRSHPEAWMTAIHPEDREMAAKIFWEGVHSGQGFAFESRSLRAKDGAYQRHLQQAVVLRDTEGKVLKFVGTTTDIDDLKRAEERLRQAQSDLAHVARVATLNAMTASIAHEVSQPLSGIMTNASTSLRMLAAEPPNVAGAVETARRTIRDAGRASGIVKRLRELFSNRISANELVDLNNAALDVIAISGGELQRRSARLQTEFADGLPPVSANRVQLQQVILNLLLNAADAMDGIEDRPRSILVRTELERDGAVRLEVCDAGTGFDPATVEKLFEAFHTTKANGMGVGLSICRTIVESHKGRLWATLNEGPGATFGFSIPANAAETSGAPDPGAVGEAAKGR